MSATIPAGKASGYNVLDWARYAITELMDDANLQQNVLMHLIGQSPTGGSGTFMRSRKKRCPVRRRHQSERCA